MSATPTASPTTTSQPRPTSVTARFSVEVGDGSYLYNFDFIAVLSMMFFRVPKLGDSVVYEDRRVLGEWPSVWNVYFPPYL